VAPEHCGRGTYGVLVQNGQAYRGALSEVDRSVCLGSTGLYRGGAGNGAGLSPHDSALTPNLARSAHRGQLVLRITGVE
jgi:hypothetical protein